MGQLKVLILLINFFGFAAYAANSTYEDKGSGSGVTIEDMRSPQLAKGQWQTYQGKIQRINSLEVAGQLGLALREAKQLVQNIYVDIGVNRKVVRVHHSINAIQDEVLVKKEWGQESHSFQAGLNAFFFGGSVSHDESSSWSYDTTKIVNRNPWEVASLGAQARDSMGSIQNAMIGYIANHSAEIVLMKEAGIKAFELATRITAAGGKVQEDMITLGQNLFDLNFVGVHQVTSCVETHYTNSGSDVVKDSHSSASAWLLFISASGEASSHYENHVRHFAHVEKSCNSNINEASFSTKQLGVKANFSALDALLFDWMKVYFSGNTFKVGPGEGQTVEEYIQTVPTFGLDIFEQ